MPLLTRIHPDRPPYVIVELQLQTDTPFVSPTVQVTS
jgi:hypothetical protein